MLFSGLQFTLHEALRRDGDIRKTTWLGLSNKLMLKFVKQACPGIKENAICFYDSRDVSQEQIVDYVTMKHEFDAIEIGAIMALGKQHCKEYGLCQ